MSDAVRYADEPGLGVDEFIDVLRRSILAERRPVDDCCRIARMLQHADIKLCARSSDGLLTGYYAHIGLTRSERAFTLDRR